MWEGIITSTENLRFQYALKEKETNCKNEGKKEGKRMAIKNYRESEKLNWLNWRLTE